MNFSELVEAVSNVSSKQKYGKLTAAIENKDNTTALSLIQNKTLADRIYRSGFYIMNGGTSLLDKGWGRSPLERAASDGNLEVLNALLQAGAEVDQKNFLDWTPLQFALLYKHDAAAIALINAGADVNASFKDTRSHHDYDESDRFFPMHEAISANVGFPVIKLLVEKGAELNLPWEYKNLMIEAARQIPDENAATIEFLLEHGANPNKGNESYDINLYTSFYTPLFIALQAGKHRIALTLLKHGAKIFALKPDVYKRFNKDRFILTEEMIATAIKLCEANGLPIPENNADKQKHKIKPRL